MTNRPIRATGDQKALSNDRVDQSDGISRVVLWEERANCDKERWEDFS
jgi:hypothetical protein